MRLLLNSLHVEAIFPRHFFTKAIMATLRKGRTNMRARLQPPPAAEGGSAADATYRRAGGAAAAAFYKYEQQLMPLLKN